MNLADAFKGRKIILPKRKWVLRPEVLLHGNIPKPMHGVAPRNILGAKWWNEERQKAYKSTDFHCIACGVYKHNAEYRRWLEAHEMYSINYLKGLMEYVEAVPLCHLCHNSIHSGRLAALLEKGEISQAKFAAIIQHRDRVLAQAGLELALPYEGPFAPWKDWKLILYGKKYPPIYKTYEAWCKAMEEK